MDDKRSEHVNEDPIDRELRRALSIAHSPEFVARVRDRIHHQPARTRPTMLTGLVVLASAVVAVVVFALGWWNDVYPKPSLNWYGKPAIRQTSATESTGTDRSSLLKTSAQFRVPRQGEGRVISGGDIGFRIDGIDGDKVVGRIVVRINGEWVEAGVQTITQRIVPLGTK
jgi:hypothetical protein